jgi:AraC-like DNA-binding protein
MNDVRLSTDTVAEGERVAYWRDAVCDTFVELECDATRTSRFFGSLTSRQAGAIQYSQVQSAPQHVARTRHKISQSGLDYFLLSLQTGGQGVIEQDGRTAVLRVGDFALYDTTRPYDLWFEDRFSQLVLRLPRRILTERVFDAEQFTALRIDGSTGAGRVASVFFRQLHRELAHVAGASVEQLHASGVDLLATAFSEQTGALATLSEPHRVLKHRICTYIDRHLSDVELSCESIASAHGISERYLRKLFAAGPMSASERIWSRRLNQAKRDLIDPMLRHRTVTSIGYDIGFKDPAHFSRAFKARFGVTPTAWRRAPHP